MTRKGQTTTEWAKEQRDFRAAGSTRAGRPSSDSSPQACPDCGQPRRNSETLRAHRALAHEVFA